MATAQPNVDVEQYLRVNVNDAGSIILHARHDTVRVVFADAKPARSTNIYHLLDPRHPPLQIPYFSTNVWVLATTARAVVTVTEGEAVPGATVDPGSFPADYPLPAAQVSTLTPQTDALTDAELRASAVDVNTGITQPTTPADTQPVSAASLPLPTGAATSAKQLPDNHQVTVSNQIDQPLTDAQLRATPVPVSGTFTTTPSGTQDVNVVSSTEIEVTLNGEPVELWRGGSQADALFVQWSGSQQVTVQGSVQVVTQGNSRLSVDAAQDGAWSVSVDNFPTSFDVGNFPTEYPLPASQVTTLTPQTDALTEAQLRTVIPDTAGTWAYVAGTSGTPTISGRVLQITATAGLTAGSLTINGGNTVTVPAGKSITIEPRGNLTSPTVVFTGTQAYFVEVVS